MLSALDEEKDTRCNQEPSSSPQVRWGAVSVLRAESGVFFLGDALSESLVHEDASLRFSG